MVARSLVPATEHCRLPTSSCPSALRKEYTPPDKENILRFRSHHYQGEAHPSTRKSVVTVQVADLFNSGKLHSTAARKKLLLLAGVRWDALGKESEYKDEQALEVAVLEEGIGRIKISCERFPEERMNLKWCSDTIDKLIEEANVSSPAVVPALDVLCSHTRISLPLSHCQTQAEQVADVPLDLRALRIREAKRTGFDRRRAPSIRDFPQEWLPGHASS